MGVSLDLVCGNVTGYDKQTGGVGVVVQQKYYYESDFGLGA